MAICHSRPSGTLNTALFRGYRPDQLSQPPWAGAYQRRVLSHTVSRKHGHVARYCVEAGVTSPRSNLLNSICSPFYFQPIHLPCELLNFLPRYTVENRRRRQHFSFNSPTAFKAASIMPLSVSTFRRSVLKSPTSAKYKFASLLADNRLHRPASSLLFGAGK